MTDRSGIEIDYCPVCRGVWLDRGELDKIIERASAAPSVATPPPAPRPRYDDRKDSNDFFVPKKKNKKKSMLSEIFDF
jgi:Zn-finger nucleic acid-binding protein